METIDKMTKRSWMLMFAASLVLSGRIAKACSCPGIADPSVALIELDAVFRGKVTRTISFWSEERHREQVFVVFEVVSVWKGVSLDRAVVYADGAGCAPLLEEGREYFIFAESRWPLLETSQCWPNALVSGAGVAYSAIGPGTKPIPVAVLLVAGLAGFIALIVVLARSRRNARANASVPDR